MESNSPNHSLVAMGSDRVSPVPLCDDNAFSNPSTSDNNDVLKALETMMTKQTQQLLEQVRNISKGFSSVPSSSTLPDGPNNPSRDDSMFVVHDDEADGSEKEKSKQTTAECDIYRDVSSKLKELEMTWANDWVQEIAKNGGGERKGLLIANTYSKKSKDDLKKLSGTATSALAMKKAFYDGLKDLGKTPISCNVKNNLSQNDLVSNVVDFARNCNQDKVNTLVFYFAGHGGHQSLESDDSVVVGPIKGKDGFFDRDRCKTMVGESPPIFKEGGNFILADADEEGNCGKISKSRLISIICSETPEVKHRIIIFDCCRGDKTKEKMSSADAPEAKEFTFEVEYSLLQSLNNADFKNTYVFHSTLPHQVAWLKDLTNFSKYFTKFLGHMDLSCMDVAINAALKHGERDDHIQMVELVKRVDTPFKF